MASNMETESIVTVVSNKTGQSESLPVSLTSTTVADLTGWVTALLGFDGPVELLKDGRVLEPASQLAQAGVAHGDLLAAQEVGGAAPAPAPSNNAAATGGLDFSNLLAGAMSGAAAAAPSSGGGGLDFSNLLQQQAYSGNRNEPVYYPGMSFNEAMDENPNPNHMITLLQTKEHLFKELNYHNPSLANKLRGQPYERAVQVWREEILKGGIQLAVSKTETYHKESTFRRRLQENSNDAEAKEYFDSQKRKQKVQEQYLQMMQEYPESLGRVLMLYVNAKINGHAIQAFVDSGAQSTIMSKRMAQRCGLLDYLDTRFAGVAVGVGTGTILGRCHMVQLQLGDYHFPCTVTIMDDPPPDSTGATKEMEFLLGLDMLKRHTCSIDLERHVLKFRLAPGQYMETPFLHEKDLDESKGGTKGFNAEKANQDLLELQRKAEEEEQAKAKDGKKE